MMMLIDEALFCLNENGNGRKSGGGENPPETTARGESPQKPPQVGILRSPPAPRPHPPVTLAHHAPVTPTLAHQPRPYPSPFRPRPPSPTLLTGGSKNFRADFDREPAGDFCLVVRMDAAGNVADVVRDADAARRTGRSLNAGHCAGLCDPYRRVACTDATRGRAVRAGGLPVPERKRRRKRRRRS